MGHRHGWALATGAALLLLGGAVLPPFVDEGARLVVRQAFAPICHQLPARSFSIGGVPLATCHRCFGIYVGLVAGTLAWPRLPARLQGRIGRRAGWLVLAAGLPAALDWGAGALDGLANTPVTRTATGGMLGMAMGLLFARATARALGRDRGAPTGGERSSRPF